MKSGFIAIAIDHNELGYLIVLADEIFDRKNRIGIVTVVNNPMGRNQGKYFSTTNDFMLVYANCIEHAEFNKVVLLEENMKQFNLSDTKGSYKLESLIRIGGGNENLRHNKPNRWYPLYANPESNDVSFAPKENYIEVFPITSSGQERTWMWVKDSVEYKRNDLEVVVKNGKVEIYRKYRIQNGVKVKTVWFDKKYDSNNKGTKLLEKLIGRKSVSYPKSLYTVKDVIKLLSGKDDFILDFFAGSGTTGQAVLELNQEDGGKRKFILVEQLNEHIHVCINRFQNLFYENDTIVYFSLKQNNDVYIERLHRADDKYCVLLWNALKNNSSISYRADFQKVSEEEFEQLSLADKKKILLNLLDKNVIYVSHKEIDDEDFSISEKDKSLNRLFYSE